MAPPNPEGRTALEQAGLPPLLAAVLSARGINTAEQARSLLDPPQQELYDPLLLKDMDQAVRRIRQAIQTGETVAVYGDYDVTASLPPVGSPIFSPIRDFP